VRKTTLIFGLLLVALALLFAGVGLEITSAETVWPFIILLIGIAFALTSSGRSRMIMPGTMLIVSSLPLIYCSLKGDWGEMVTLWPFFILAPAAGFFFSGIRDRKNWWPALSLGGIAVLFFFIFRTFTIFWPLLFLVCGLILIGVSTYRSSTNSPKTASKNPK